MVYLALFTGFVLLISGGDVLVRAAVALADWLKVPKLLVGLTIVALGTSAPELTVAVSASIKQAPDLVSGTVIGSNIANVLLILGAAAVISPIATHIKMIRRDGLMLVAVSACAAGFAVAGVIDTGWGILMITAFIVYAFYSYRSERRSQAQAETAAELAAKEIDEFRGISPDPAYALPAAVAGCGAVILGADLLIDAAIEIARDFQISEAVIGLSLVAIGTSLPELAIAVIAALRGESEIALGNAVGSNLSNILVILGAAALFGPIPISGQIATYDVWIMLGSAVFLVPVMLTDSKLSRAEGVLFLTCYAAYISSLYLGVPEYVRQLLM